MSRRQPPWAFAQKVPSFRGAAEGCEPGTHIPEAGVYGFRARRFAAPRNDRYLTLSVQGPAAERERAILFAGALAHKLRTRSTNRFKVGIAMATGEQLPNAVLRQVAWRDLVALTPAEVARELALPLPWLAASLAAAACGLYPLALAFSFVFFLAGLRIVHGACHYALGLSRRPTEIVLFVLSLVMLGSMHAVQWNHLRHHRRCLATDDIEAVGARGSARRAILLGPIFPVRLHRAALAGARGRERRWMLAELVGNLAVVGLVVGVLPEPVLLYHLSAMAVGQCLTAFFAVWTVHHDCAEAVPPARTIRHPVRSIITFNMFFHLEHHLFPQIPTAHLPVLARRLDATVPRGRWLLVW